MDDFKPFRIQFDLEDKDMVDKLRELANELGDKRRDRRVGAGATAKALIEHILKSSRADELLQFLADESSLTTTIAAESRAEYETPKKAYKPR